MVTKQVKETEPLRANLPTPVPSEMQLVREFVERHEKLGHLFFWMDIIGAVHLIPTGWVDGMQCESFIALHGDALNIFLYERSLQG